MSDKTKKGTHVFHLMTGLQKLKHNPELLLDTVEEKLLCFQRLVELSQLLNTAMEFKNIKKKALSKIRAIVNCEEVVFFRVKNGILTFDGDTNGQKIANKEVAMSRLSLIGECAHYKAMRHVSDPQSDLRFKREVRFFSSKEVKNLLLSPLVIQGEVLGVLVAVNSFNTNHHFNDEDMYFMSMASGQFSMALQTDQLFENLQTQFVQVTEALGDTLVKKDRYTGGHTKRVGMFAEMVGRELNLTAKEIVDVKLASILHDIGKIGIEDKILRKTSPLTDEEFEVMKAHPKLGFEILGHIQGFENVANGMRYHHERPDGKGYPYGLKGDEIPLIAQIVSVADAFDSMISTRPYRKGLPPMVGYHEIRKHRGTQFSEVVVDAFVRAFKKSRMYVASEDEYLEDIKKAA